MNKILYWLMNTRFYVWFLSRVMPHLRFSTGYTRIKGWQYHAGYALLQSGDLICSADRNKASAVVPGDLSHLDICIVKDPKIKFEAVGMTSKDFTKVHFFDICKESDQVVIFRPDFDEAYRNLFLENVMKMSFSIYDYEYDLLDPNKVFCTELGYHADTEKRIGWKIGKDLLGRPTIIPDSFYQTKGLRVIWDSDKV